MESRKKSDVFELLSILPFIIVIFSPLVVKGKVLEVSAEASKYWNNNLVIDFFSYYKSIAIIFSAGIALLLTLIGFINKRIELNRKAISIPLVVYSMFLFLTNSFSQYPKTSLFGFPERYEGLLVQISYVIIFVTFTQLISTNKQIRVIMTSIIICVGIVSIIGLTQFIGNDLLRTVIIKYFIFGNTFRNAILYQYELGNIDSLMNNIYATLYNSNTLGHYMGMILPFCMYLVFFTRRTKQKIALAVISALVLINLFGSLSRGSIIGSLSVLLISMIIAKYTRLISAKDVIIGVGIIAIVITATNSYSGGRISDRVSTILEIGTNHAENEKIDKIKQFSITGNILLLESTNQVINVIASSDNISFYDESLERLNIYENNNTGELMILDDRFKDVKVIWLEGFLRIQKGKSFLLFKLHDENFYFINTNGELLEETVIESFGFEGFERIGSGRGYIWSRSLPIIKRTILLGTGIDTYAYEFPQGDFKGKLRYMYDAYLLIDKPHNLFLQMAVNSGLISLVAFILFLSQWFKSIIFKINEDNNQLVLGVTSSVLSFLICGLFTDSTVSVTPTFWILLAIGQTNFSLNTVSLNEIELKELNLDPDKMGCRILSTIKNRQIF